MASVMRLAMGTLNSVVHHATNVCSAPLRLLSASRSACAPTLRQGVATTNKLHTSLTVRSSSLLVSVSSPKTSVLQNVQKLGPMIGAPSCRGYHVRVALKKRCSSCFFVRRKGRLFVECKAKPRHKQMQVMSKRKTWKEDYSKGFIQGALYWNYYRDHGYYKLGNTPYARHDWLKGKIGVTV